MTFKVTWTKPNGSRGGFEGKSAKNTVWEIGECGLHQESPGLRIRDGGGVALKWDDLLYLATQEG
ncbi:MAG: hypothetical protein AAB403_12275 [Planctomycetota bacterium]